MQTGIASLPLHGGRAPAWLFEKMKELAAAISVVIIEDSGTEEFLKKLSDPFWFQSFGCVLGFDWHSSGLTTTVCGALKEGLKEIGPSYGLFVCGGKGRTSRKTPVEIETFAPKVALNSGELVRASKMVAKVDNSAIQDGYQLYHHTFIFTREGKWCVIQQGMNKENHYARRYHWLNFEPNFVLVDDPHTGIAAERKEPEVLNLVTKKSTTSREVSVEIAQAKPEKNIAQIKKIQELSMPRDHYIRSLRTESLRKILIKTYERQAVDFESLLEIEGVGPKTIRALSLIAELIYGAKPSWEDPAKFSFAHGGKDGIPFPVDKPVYDQSLEILKNAIIKAKIGQYDKIRAIKRLGIDN